MMQIDNADNGWIVTDSNSSYKKVFTNLIDLLHEVCRYVGTGVDYKIGDGIEIIKNSIDSEYTNQFQPSAADTFKRLVKDADEANVF